ncbi:hypothetical protein JOC45_001723 [Gordonia hydrophobica]|nr:hypothetical protein [Gordonia hydrophobica]
MAAGYAYGLDRVGETPSPYAGRQFLARIRRDDYRKGIAAARARVG